ncbi:MAG: sugar-binding transcriptional regulator [Pseudomonadota bacterium]
MAHRVQAADRLDDEEMAARAAWLHFVGGLTQSEVARRLGVPTTRAHRYIARAQNLGLVRISVDVAAASCVALEEELRARYSLDFCRVAIEIPEPDGRPLRAIGAEGAKWLMQVIASRTHQTIGVSHGRTIAAAVEAMGRIDAQGVSFVSLLGGLTRSLAANPYDVIHRLAQKTGADAYLMPAPLFADSAEDKRVMLAQTILADVRKRMSEASLAVVGIGAPQKDEGSMAAVAGGGAALKRVRQAGACAEILGQFLDADGQILKTPLDGLVMALPLNDLRGREVVAIVGGIEKRDAIKAALKSGLLTGLIIDEATARRLVEERGDARAAAE